MLVTFDCINDKADTSFSNLVWVMGSCLPKYENRAEGKAARIQILRHSHSSLPGRSQFLLPLLELETSRDLTTLSPSGCTDTGKSTFLQYLKRVAQLGMQSVFDSTQTSKKTTKRVCFGNCQT